MHNLNLYSYYDKSLADVNREYLESLKSKPKRVSKKKLDKRIILAATITLATFLLIANYLGLFSEKAIEIAEINAPPDTRTEEEKQGYVQIQIFEFAETQAEATPELVAQNNYTNNGKEIENKQIDLNNVQTQEIPINNKKNNEDVNKSNTNGNTQNNIKNNIYSNDDKKATVNMATTKTTQQKNNKEQTEEKVIVKQYSILFEDINETQYNKLTNISSTNNIKLDVADIYTNTYSIWKVYDKTESNNHIEDFLTKDDAIEYAKNKNIDVLIKQAEMTEKTYTVKLCCSALDNAKKIAENSNITDRVIKIIREK